MADYILGFHPDYAETPVKSSDAEDDGATLTAPALAAWAGAATLCLHDVPRRLHRSPLGRHLPFQGYAEGWRPVRSLRSRYRNDTFGVSRSAPWKDSP
jgi:hypothetical protein